MTKSEELETVIAAMQTIQDMQEEISRLCAHISGRRYVDARNAMAMATRHCAVTHRILSTLAKP
jgi:uncharacterized protein YicC (UPF0701 family)